MILIGLDQVFGPQCFNLDSAGYFIGLHATAVGLKQQESMNHGSTTSQRNGRSYTAAKVVETLRKQGRV
jgi:hypothetical protein